MVVRAPHDCVLFIDARVNVPNAGTQSVSGCGAHGMTSNARTLLFLHFSFACSQGHLDTAPAGYPGASFGLSISAAAAATSCFPRQVSFSECGVEGFTDMQEWVTFISNLSGGPSSWSVEHLCFRLALWLPLSSSPLRLSLSRGYSPAISPVTWRSNRPATAGCIGDPSAELICACERV